MRPNVRAARASTASEPLRHVSASTCPGDCPQDSRLANWPRNSPVGRGADGRLAPGTVPGTRLFRARPRRPSSRPRRRGGTACRAATRRPFASPGYTDVADWRRFDRSRHGRSHRCCSSPCARPPRPSGKNAQSHGCSSCSPSGVRRVGRPASTISHSSSAVLVVVRTDALAGRQLIDRQPELLGPDQRPDARIRRVVARRGSSSSFFTSTSKRLTSLTTRPPSSRPARRVARGAGSPARRP